LRRSNQQTIRLIQGLVRLVRSGRLPVRWLVGLVVLAAAYLLMQPLLVRSLGIDLPGLGDLTGIVSETPATEQQPTEQPKQKKSPAADEINQILRDGSQQTYESPAGLLYRRGSQHGHRLKHLMAHAKDQPDRPGQHGVFDSEQPEEIVAVVDEAYRQAQTGKKVQVEREGERTVYTVDLNRRVGFIGGESGNRRNRPAARHIRLVVEDRNFITAFPYRP